MTMTPDEFTQLHRATTSSSGSASSRSPARRPTSDRLDARCTCCRAGAAKGLVEALQARFRAETGAAVAGRFGAVGAMREALLAGEPCDVMIADRRDDRCAHGGRRRCARGTRAPLGRVRTGIAVPTRRAAARRVDARRRCATRCWRPTRIYFPDPERATAGIHFVDGAAATGHPRRTCAAPAHLPERRDRDARAGRRSAAAAADRLHAGHRDPVHPRRRAGRAAARRSSSWRRVYTAAVAQRAVQPELAARFIAPAGWRADAGACAPRPASRFDGDPQCNAACLILALPACWPARRGKPGAGLSRHADPLHRAGGRRRRHRPGRAHGHRALGQAAGPDLRRREPERRRRRRRLPGHRARRARRLHADAGLRRHARHQPGTRASCPTTRSRTSRRSAWSAARRTCWWSTPTLPVQTLAEFVDYVKQQPGQASATARPGQGSLTHLAMELFKQATGAFMRAHPLPRHRARPSPTCSAARRRRCSRASPPRCRTSARAAMRPLAVTGHEAPSAAAGRADARGVGLQGLRRHAVVRHRRPGRHAARRSCKTLNDEIDAVLAAPDLRERLSGEALEPMPMTPEQFGAVHPRRHRALDQAGARAQHRARRLNDRITHGTQHPGRRRPQRAAGHAHAGALRRHPSVARLERRRRARGAPHASQLAGLRDRRGAPRGGRRRAGRGARCCSRRRRPPCSAARERVDMASAALVNGITSHTFDFDDTHLKTIIHPAGPVASARAGAGRAHRRQRAAQLIDALVLGIDVVVPRRQRRCTPTTTTAAGTSPARPACSARPPAARACSASTSSSTAMALGIAASQPVGMREQFGTMTKPFHPGGAARAGLMSALLAKHGFTASAARARGAARLRAGGLDQVRLERDHRRARRALRDLASTPTSRSPAAS